MPDEEKEINSEGWVKLYRSMTSCKTASRGLNFFGAMSWMVVKANYEDSWYNGDKIKRGQLFCGLRFLSKEWKIGTQSVRTLLRYLAEDGFLTLKPTRKGTIVTICNYETYQMKPETSQHNIQHTPNTRPTHDQHTPNTLKEYKEDQEYKEESTRTGEDFQFSADETGNLSDAERIEWQKWLTVWQEMHGKGKPMSAIMREAKLANLLRVPAEYRLASLQKAVAGGWKNVCDVSKDEKRGKGGKAKFDPMDPSTFMIGGGNG